MAMENEIKHRILELSREAHELTESGYRTDPAVRGDAGWGDKQRILLADMALHLLQTSLRDGDIAPEQLQRNLYSILKISAQFLPGQELEKVADRLQ